MTRTNFVRGVPFYLQLTALALVVLTGRARAQVCDEFPDVHTKWSFRVPKCGPEFSLIERDGYARLRLPDGALSGAGNYDSWSGADMAPTLERTDMGSGDWTITTRLDFETPVLGTTYHAALMFRFGPAEKNDVVYWGEYTANGTLAVERVGNNIRPIYTIDPGPVSIQVQKIGNEYHFRHRNDDSLDWIEDLVDTTRFLSPDPVTSVGLIGKTWGLGPEVIADFDYFCLEVPNVTLPTDVVTDPIPVASPITGLSCDKRVDGSLALAWSVCPGSESPVVVRISGTTVANLPANATDVTIQPPLPGGTIVSVEVDNAFHSPARCTIAPTLVDSCDEFDEDPLGGDIWKFRARKLVDAGPKVSVEENPGFLRFFVPDGATAGGPFDNWAGVDLAPSLERYDMGPRDWVISTRVSFPNGPTAVSHHVGLFVGWGLGTPDDSFNDVLYWGEYNTDLTLRVERTGAAVTGMLPYLGAPVSLQVQKVANTLIFSHRQDDGDPWTADGTAPITLPYPANAAASPPAGTPVSRVGLLIKTWGGGPEVTADFDYFCLQIADSPPEAVIVANPEGGKLPLEVTFSGVDSVDPSDGTLTYQWDFGDGQTGTGMDVKHTYTTPGIRTVKLTVTDNDKNTGSTTMDIYISDDTSPFVLDRLGTAGGNGLVTVDRSGAQPLYCVTSGGNNISLATDNAFLLEQKLSGNFQVRAKITSGDVSPVKARSGLMARLTSDARSPNIMMSIDGIDDGYQFQFRKTNGGTTSRPSPNPRLDPPRGALPAWVGLERQGSLFIGSYSTDGTTFTEYARQEMPILDVAELMVGFAATSGDNPTQLNYCAELSGFGASPPPPPAKPAGLAATAGNGSVQLDWSDNTEANLQGYNLYRSEGGGAFAKVNTTLIAASNFNDPGRTNGTEYCYRVRAVNPGGESPDSDQACATPSGGGGTGFRRGDADANGTLELTDAIFVLNNQFLGGPNPSCMDAADVDDSGVYDLTDAIYSLGFQFLGGPAPPPPGAGPACGSDPSNDTFPACTYPGC